MIETISFKDETYPKFQAEGFASKFAFPFALEVCKGKGVDIGCHKEEWAFPGAMCIDTSLNNQYSAYNFPPEQNELDYIFSSHCLEHIYNWVDVLDYWHSKLRDGGVLFLYLPDHSQKYWRPWHNRKHVNSFTPEIIKSYFVDTDKWKNIFVSGVDLNNSFMVMCEKK